MTDISIPFHANPQELVPFVRDCLREHGLLFAGILDPPFSISEIKENALESMIVSGPCDRFFFTERLPSATVRSASSLADELPGVLYLDVGREQAGSLQQSWLACRTGTAPINPKWKKIAAKLRGMTKAGATAVSPTNGGKSVLKSHRFTPGAKELADAGTIIRPIAGNAELEFE